VKSLTAFNLAAWIDEHRNQLKPPVCNQQVIDAGERKDITIGEGEMLLLTPRVPHSPQRFAHAVGLVVEQLPPVFDRSYSSKKHRRCDKCDTFMPRPVKS